MLAAMLYCADLKNPTEINLTRFYCNLLKKEKKMRSLDRIFLLLFFLSLAGYGFPPNADSQPFGFLQQKGGTGSQKKVLSTPGGRFIFGQVSESGKDQFMLDTHMGRLWKISERGDIGLFLTSIPYRTAEGKYVPVPESLQVPGTEESMKK